MLKRLLRRTPAKPPVIGRQRDDKAASRWAAVMPPLGRRMRVERIEADTDQAVRVSLRPVEGAAVGFRAGQYLSCCFQIDGEQLRRPYSICNVQGSETIELTCKRVPDGVVSNYVCDRLAPGDEFEVRGPNGSFCLEDSSAPLYCVAAGSGITPVISLIETALQEQPERLVQLIYANRNQAAILFSDRLQALQAEHAPLHVTHVLSQPDAGWTGPSGRLDGERIVKEFAPPAQAQVYLCGPQSLMQDVQTALQGQGFDAQQIHSEVFTPAARAQQAHPSEPQIIVFGKSGQRIEQAPGQSILDAALAHGVALDFSCTVGGCAACKVQVLEGEVMMDEPHCLSEAERAQGLTLACSAYATQAVVLDA